MPKDFAKKILAIKKEYLERVLGDVLDNGEIEAAMDRIEIIKSAISYLAESEKHDWIFKNQKGEITYTEETDDEIRLLESLQGLRKDYAKNKEKLDSDTLFNSESLYKMDIDDMIKKRHKK